MTVNREGRIEYINRTGSHLSREEVIGRYYWDFLEEPQRTQAQELIRQISAGAEPQYFESEAYDPDGRKLGWYSARIGPLEKDGQVCGVIIVSSNITERRQTEEALRESQAQLKELSARQQCALEQERRRIARELHDELGQLLTALNIDLAWLERRIDEPQVQERLGSMKQILSTTVESVRRLSSTLRPPLLDDLGLAAALDWLLGETCPRAGLEYHLSAALPAVPLTEECSLGLYRICQEAVTNVVRHAQARRLEVELSNDLQNLLLRVQDDGVGMALERCNRSLGLLGIRERVDKLRGQLTIHSAPGRGTQLVARIPLPQ